MIIRINEAVLQLRVVYGVDFDYLFRQGQTQTRAFGKWRTFIQVLCLGTLVFHILHLLAEATSQISSTKQTAHYAKRRKYTS